MDAVEVDRVRVMRGVAERDPQPLTLATAQRRARDPLVVGPRLETHPWRDLDLLRDRVQVPLAQDATAGEPACAAPVEVARDRVGIEAVARVVDGPAVAEARVAGRGVVVIKRGRARVVLPRMAVRNRRVQQACAGDRA